MNTPSDDKSGFYFSERTIRKVLRILGEDEVYMMDDENYSPILKNEQYLILVNKNDFSLMILFSQMPEKEELYKVEKGLALTKILCNRPSEDILTMAYTEDLKQCWEELRFCNFYIGINFLKFYLKIRGYASNIPCDNELTEDFIYFIGQINYEIWNVVELIYPAYKKIFSQYLKNPQALFAFLMQEQGEFYFREILLNDYVEFHTKKKTEMIHLKLQACKQQIKDEKNPDVPNINNLSFIELIILLVSKSTKLAKNRRLQLHAENYNNATVQMLATAEQMGLKRTEKGMLIPSYIWDTGRIVEGGWGGKKKG